MATKLPAANPAPTDPNAPQAQLSITQQIALNIDRLKFAAAVLQGAPASFGDKRIGFDPSKWIEEGRAARAEFVKQMEAAGMPGWRIPTSPLEVSIGSNDLLQTLILQALASYAEEERAIRAANPDPRLSRPNTAMDARNAALYKAVEEALTPGREANARAQTLQEQLAYNGQRLADLRSGKP